MKNQNLIGTFTVVCALLVSANVALAGNYNDPRRLSENSNRSEGKPD